MRVRRLLIRARLLWLLAVWCLAVSAAERELRLYRDTDGLFVQVLGDKDEDWFIEATTDLTNWFGLEGIRTVLSDPTNAPARSVGAISDEPLFYRARRTQGLFDTNLLRTIHLTFTNSNWQELLAIGRTNGVNTPALLTLDNGVVVTNVGARYRGNSSFYEGEKKSINLEVDFGDPEADLMSHSTVNLNNAAGDSTMLREIIYFHVMRQYAPCPDAAIVQLMINGTNWGVYTLVQQGNNRLMREYFASDEGDRWRTPNLPSSTSDFRDLGNITNEYLPHYDLVSNNSTNAWERLLNAIHVLNRTPIAPTNVFREKLDETFAVDSWLWFLAIENVFADPDGYLSKGSDFSFYYELESGRIHPVQHDGNEAFRLADVTLLPMHGGPGTGVNRPLLTKFFSVREFRQRYLAHMRALLAEQFNPATMGQTIDYYHQLSAAAIATDPKKSFTMAVYTNELQTLKTWITNRHTYLSNYFRLIAPGPRIVVYGPTNPPGPNETPYVTAEIEAEGTNGIDSVWLYWRDKTYGAFSKSQMFDDGAHSDGSSADGVYGGATTNFPAGRKIHYYVEARSANTGQSSSFAPARAEIETFSYRVGLVSAPSTPVVINELMASNASTLADPQGEFDDWIELRNVTEAEVDLTGHYLSDEPNNMTKWRFPDGTKIAANGYLLVWADEDGKDAPGLHASFKLSAGGETIFLTDTDENQNALLDSVEFGIQRTDRSFGRSRENAARFVEMEPTPGQQN